MRPISVNILTAVAAFLLIVTSAIPVQAAFNCDNLYVEPAAPNLGVETVVYSEAPALNRNSTAILRIPSVSYEEVYEHNSDVTTPVVFYFTPQEIGMQQGTTYGIEVLVIDPLGNPTTCNKSVTIAGTEEKFCGPVGLTEVTPLSGNTNSIFTFKGCVGGGGTNPGVALFNTAQPNTSIGEVKIVSVTQPEGDSLGGLFTVSREGMPSEGVYSAQLYTDGSPQGGGITFTVDSANSQCLESVTCSVNGVTGSQECSGFRTTGSCSYDPATDCGPCRYCGDQVCDQSENTASCPGDCPRPGQEETEEQKPIDRFHFCNQIGGEGESQVSQRQACIECVGNEENPTLDGNLYTAFGCIRKDEEGLARDLVTLLLGVAGMVALLSILAAAFLFTTSQGDSNKVKQAKELMTAAVSGLFFIIFSIIILDFIGVQLLRIPGLS